MTLVTYYLNNRGFYSEINNLILGYIYAIDNEYNFRVDSSTSKLYFQKGFEYYFESININNTNNKISKSLIINGVHCLNFKKIRLQNISFQKKRNITKNIIKYTDKANSEIQKVINRLNLPSNYTTFHVRRGDKIGEKPTLTWTTKSGKYEADRFEIDEYFLKINTKINNLFVMTDDFKVISDIKKYISSKKLNIKIYYLCDETDDGYSTLSLLQNKEYYDEKDVIKLLAEIEIAKNSYYFVGTFSSNVSRYVKLIHKNPKNCFSLDMLWFPE